MKSEHLTRRLYVRNLHSGGTEKRWIFMDETKLKHLDDLLNSAVKEFKQILETYKTSKVEKELSDLKMRAEELKAKQNLDTLEQVTFSGKDETLLRTVETLEDSKRILHHFNVLSDKIVATRATIHSQFFTTHETSGRDRKIFSDPENNGQWGYVETLEDAVCEIFQKLLELKEETEQDYISAKLPTSE